MRNVSKNRKGFEFDNRQVNRGVMGKSYGSHEEELRWAYLGICEIPVVVFVVRFSWNTKGWGDFLKAISRSTGLK